jgi:helicase
MHKIQKYHIVSIGVSKHQESFISSLEYAHKDAADFSKLIELNVEKIGYNILLTDSEATLAKIRTALGSDLLREVGEDDYFFFFYSGHGTIDDESGGNGYSHYIVPFDATRDIKNSCIPVTYLKEVFDNIKCKSSIVFLDSCFSGGINSKHLPNLRKKSFKDLKTFTNTL